MSEGKKREKTYKDQEIEARLKTELPPKSARKPIRIKKSKPGSRPNCRAGIIAMGSSAANTRRMGGRARSW